MNGKNEPERKRRRLFLVLALLIVSLLTACGTPNQTRQTSSLECERLGYPCSFAEVELGVLQQSLDLADEVAEMLADGASVDEAMDMLAEVPGMASVEGSDEAVVFRLEGGRPTVINPAIDQPLLGESTPLSAQSAALRPQRVVGGGGDKSALVLALFPFDFAGADSASYVAQLLDSTPDYAGRVTYKASPNAENPAVTIDDLKHLDEYDVVYMTTHGGKLCTDKKATIKKMGGALDAAGQGGGAADCRTDFLLQRFHGTAADLRTIDTPGVVLYHGSRYRSIAVTADFFSHHYPSGLGDTLFVLLSCSTFADDFSNAIVGSETVYVSWDNLVDADHAQATAALMEQMLVRGLTVAQALAEVGDDGFDASHGGRLRAAGNAAGMRIRDPMKVFEGFSGDELATLQDIAVIGTPDDGQNDSLLLYADVLGLLDDDLSDARVRVSVDGAERLSGSVAELGERGEDTQVRLTLEVPLRRDTQAGRRLTIEVRLDLPEGGSATAVGQPHVIGEENLGVLWEAELVTVVKPFDATLGTARMQANVDFQRDPAQPLEEPNPVYRMVGGDYRYTLTGGVIAGECSVSLTASGALGRRDDTAITFDRSGEVTTVSGWGTAGTPSANASVRCPSSNFTLNLPTDQVIVNIPAALNHRLSGGTFSGAYSESTAMADITWTWTFRRVQ